MTQYDDDMVDAYRAATNSPDPSTQNGAVLIVQTPWVSREARRRISGFNGFPAGINPVHWNGPKEGKYARVVHAEVAAILNAARDGLPTEDSTLVAPWAACSNCAKHIAHAGVTTLVRHKFLDNGVTTNNYWHDDCMVGDEIMVEAGIRIIEIDPVSGTSIELRRDGKIWTP